MFEMFDDQFVEMNPIWLNKKDNPTTIDGEPVYVSSDENIVKFAPDPETGKMCAWGVSAGEVQVLCKGDADRSEGVRELILEGRIKVNASEAVAGTLNFGTPKDQPVTPTEG